MPRLRRDSVEIYYDDRGQGDAILLLHDYFGTHQTWGAQSRLLSRYFRVISPDLRAHGKSGSGDRRLRLDDLAVDALALIDEVGVAAVHIVGVSLGAVLALNLAREHPSRVLSAVACSVPYFGEPSAVRYARRFVAEVFPSIESEIAQRHQDLGSRHARQVLLPNFRQDLEERPPGHSDAYERAEEISVPVLVLCGDRDPVFPVERAAALYSSLQQGSLAVIPGAGHNPHREFPSAFDAALLDFLLRGRSSELPEDRSDARQSEPGRRAPRSRRRRSQ